MREQTPVLWELVAQLQEGRNFVGLLGLDPERGSFNIGRYQCCPDDTSIWVLYPGGYTGHVGGQGIWYSMRTRSRVCILPHAY